jgi:hypothetical protein
VLTGGDRWPPLERPLSGEIPAHRISAGGLQPDEERTGEVLAGRPTRRWWLGRLDPRSRSILIAAAIAAMTVNAGAVWAYWRISGPEAGRTPAGTDLELNLRGRSDLNKPLVPGGTGNLTVTVTNDHNFAIRIVSVSPGVGNIIANDEHREAGCLNTGVIVAHSSVKVRWYVPRNTVGAFTVPDGLAMTAGSDKACAGATFTVPVLVRGIAGSS